LVKQSVEMDFFKKGESEYDGCWEEKASSE